ncbi:MAG: 2-deoxy-D-gluconate 3-dehydrogenase, partial [Thermoplasmata archaeon]|nr:2-deoxy-D-gluconate 3-dehydrogenase [Thermoplasmata archaeon]
MLDKFRIGGKVAIVTGSQRGLGKGIALCLAEAGADIVSFDIND